MGFILFLTAVIGASAVVQGSLNSRLANQVGYPTTILVNNLVLLFWGCVLWGLARFLPNLLPVDLQNPGVSNTTPSSPGLFQWLIPGCVGILIVVGVPFVIGRLGAARVFLLLIGVQIITSLLWDAFQNQNETQIGWRQIVGALLTGVGAWLAYTR
jgi:uncharacterized membrane protein YdcZ (DUF606 family)